MEKEYAQIYGMLWNFWSNMVEILGEETVNRQDFRQTSGNRIKPGQSGSDPAKYGPGTCGRYGENQAEGYPCTGFLWE